MDFFKQLTNIAPGLDLTMKIGQKDGKLSISVLPDGVEKIHPLLLCGTPDEVDEGFFAAVSKPLYDTKVLLTNVSQYTESLQVAVKDKAVAAGKSVSNKPDVPAKKAPVKSKEEPEDQDDDESDAVEAEEKKVAKEVKPKPAKAKEPPQPVKPERELTDLEKLMQG